MAFRVLLEGTEEVCVAVAYVSGQGSSQQAAWVQEAPAKDGICRNGRRLPEEWAFTDESQLPAREMQWR